MRRCSGSMLLQGSLERAEGGVRKLGARKMRRRAATIRTAARWSLRGYAACAGGDGPRLHAVMWWRADRQSTVRCQVPGEMMTSVTVV